MPADEIVLGQASSKLLLKKALDNIYIDYELNAGADNPKAMSQIYSELHKNILDAFNEADVQIISQHYVDDPADAKVVTKEKSYAPPAKKPEDTDT